jgi:hypothetical protein
MSEIEEIQDSARQNELRKLFDLQDPGLGRMGPDAIDERGNVYELKSTTKESVGTGRDVGFHTIKEYRKKHWIFGKYEFNRSKRRWELVETYYCSPNMMKDYFDQLEKRLLPDLRYYERIRQFLVSHGCPEPLERLDYLVKRGITKNNPKIPYHYIQEHCVKIVENHAETLRKLVEKEHRLQSKITDFAKEKIL